MATWVREGGLPEEATVTTTEESTTLAIETAESKHAGTYGLVLENEYGAQTAAFVAIVVAILEVLKPHDPCGQNEQTTTSEARKTKQKEEEHNQGFASNLFYFSLLFTSFFPLCETL